MTDRVFIFCPYYVLAVLTFGIVRYHVLAIISKAAALHLRKFRLSRVTIDETMAHCELAGHSSLFPFREIWVERL